MLAPILGKPVLEWVISGVMKTNLPYVIAIPDSISDEGLVSWLDARYGSEKNKPVVYYGAKEDLIERFQTVNENMEFDPIVRICGDSPFFDPGDVFTALNIFEERGYYTMVNHVQVFSKAELKYQADNDPFIDSRQHAGTRGMAHTVDYPEDIAKYEKEWSQGSPTMDGRKKKWGVKV